MLNHLTPFTAGLEAEVFNVKSHKNSA